jgi:REP element-mobilizing transposase RayT
VDLFHNSAIFLVGWGLPHQNPLVTFQRKMLFYDELARDCLKVAIEKTRIRHPFEIIAFCLLPDHLHCIWKLPEDDFDYSKRWSSIKGQFRTIGGASPTLVYYIQ